MWTTVVTPAAAPLRPRGAMTRAADETRTTRQPAAVTETLDELRRALLDWQRQTGDRIPVKRAPDEFDRETGLPTAARIRPRPTKAEVIERGLLDR